MNHSLPCEPLQEQIWPHTVMAEENKASTRLLWAFKENIHWEAQ